MAVLDLNQCFPVGVDGNQRPLPKQKELMTTVLDPNGPKFIAYVGGVGSGKSLIGCITMLAQAIIYPGEYLIGRQFMPELLVSTYKTFFDICPPDLIIENRVADRLVRIKAQGGVSTIYFRQLEEADKLRSMNLSGFYIDEANQVSEDAFMLLQGRLRGKGLRKGYITTNPKGHDWIYRWFMSKDHFKSDDTKKAYHLIKAPSTENIHLPEDYIASMTASWSEHRIQQEVMGSFDAFEGQVYEEFRRDVHVVRPFRIPSDWERHIRIDHGFRNPAAVLFFAISPDGEVYLYREIYVREWLIKEIVLGNPKEQKKGLWDFVKGSESFKSAKIDPSTRNRRGTTGESDYDEYRRHWPEKLPPLGLAKNDVQLGIDRVKQYMKPHPKTNKPSFYIFDNCFNTLEEITTYKYPELKSNEQGVKSNNENPMKVNDHAMDALRYMIIDLPDKYKVEDLSYHERMKKYSNIEIAFQDEVAKLKQPKFKVDPFDDGI